MSLVAELMQGIASGTGEKPIAKKTAKKAAPTKKAEPAVTEVKSVLKDKSAKVKKDKDKKDKDKKKKKKDKKDKKKKK